MLERVVSWSDSAEPMMIATATPGTRVERRRGLTDKVDVGDLIMKTRPTRWVHHRRPSVRREAMTGDLCLTSALEPRSAGRNSMKLRTTIPVMVSSAAMLLATVGSASLASAGAPGSSHRAYTCTGGEIASGVYASITVTGQCNPAVDAKIFVDGNVTVAARAGFDAETAPSTLLISGNVKVGPHALLGLGCQPNTTFTPSNSAHPCTVAGTEAGHSTITVLGSIRGTGPGTVLLNDITVGGDVNLVGGGASQAGNGIPWSIKNNTIAGNLKARGMLVAFLVVNFNSIGGNATLKKITSNDLDPDPHGIIVGYNTIAGNLSCHKLLPGVWGGFNPGAHNVVLGDVTGQCTAFSSKS